jgi:Leucine-rich repeat (LRR) protein
VKYFSEIKKSKTFAAELVGLDISSNSIEKWGDEVYSSYLKK